MSASGGSNDDSLADEPTPPSGFPAPNLADAPPAVPTGEPIGATNVPVEPAAPDAPVGARSLFEPPAPGAPVGFGGGTVELGAPAVPGEAPGTGEFAAPAVPGWSPGTGEFAAPYPAAAPGQWGGPVGPYPPVAPGPPRVRRSYRKLWLSLLAVVLSVVLLAVGYTVVRYLVDSSTYDDGHQAYQRAECAAAVTEFDSVINAWRLVELGDTVTRAQAEKTECLAFQEGATRQEAGDDPAAIAAFARFVPGRPQSPLTDAARGRVTAMFGQPDLAKLATVESCDALSVLRDEKLLGPGAPGFHAVCGAAYNKAGDKKKSLATYSQLFADFGKEKVAADTEAELIKDTGWCLELDKIRADQVLAARDDLLPGLLNTCAKAPTTPVAVAIEEAEEFLKKYPGHRFTPEVRATYAQRINQQSRGDSSAKELGGAQVTRTIGGDKAVILLHNDSDQPLRIALSGPEPRVEEVDPCPTCPNVDENSRFCRDQATLKRIELAPGDYDMSVDSPESTSTAPGYSHWLLEPGKEYFACYTLTPGST